MPGIAVNTNMSGTHLIFTYNSKFLDNYIMRYDLYMYELKNQRTFLVIPVNHETIFIQYTNFIRLRQRCKRCFEYQRRNSICCFE